MNDSTVQQKKNVNKKALDKTLYDQPFQFLHSFLNFSTAFSPRRRKISSAPTIRTVKGRVVFFRAQREKISTLKPLTVRIFAAAFSPPKTGNRIFTTLHPAFVRFILAAKPPALLRRSTSAFAGLRAPHPRPQTRNRMQPLQRGKACEYGVFTPAAASFTRWAGVLYSLSPKRISAVHRAHFQPFSLSASP